VRRLGPASTTGVGTASEFRAVCALGAGAGPGADGVGAGGDGAGDEGGVALDAVDHGRRWSDQPLSDWPADMRCSQAWTTLADIDSSAAFM
jgi:hypothetical protein